KSGTVVFLHKVKKGAADKSYGIHVAQLAQLPEEILSRARVLLENFESGKEITTPQEINEQPVQMTLFSEEEPISSAEAEVLKNLEKVNILGTSPMQAMNILYELQQQLLNAKK
ncbi:DNA mismatch repair protein MutS, partial [Bacillus sp. MHSD17]|nr:DNA mismatch repair protein MutS [Bacillus sp. MHSD17]